MYKNLLKQKKRPYQKNLRGDDDKPRELSRTRRFLGLLSKITSSLKFLLKMGKHLLWSKNE